MSCVHYSVFPAMSQYDNGVFSSNLNAEAKEYVYNSNPPSTYERGTLNICSHSLAK